MDMHKMREILVAVARMPEGYRKIRKQEMINDYSPHMDELGMEILHDLLGEPAQSERGARASETVRRMAKRDLESRS